MGPQGKVFMASAVSHFLSHSSCLWSSKALFTVSLAAIEEKCLAGKEHVLLYTQTAVLLDAAHETCRIVLWQLVDLAV